MEEQKITRKQWIYLILGFLVLLGIILNAAGVGKESKEAEKPATSAVQEQARASTYKEEPDNTATGSQGGQGQAAIQIQTSEIVIVTRVIDGDTIEVTFPDGRVEKVRYIGIDTPEAGEAYAAETTAYNSALVAGKQVRMEKDVSERDQYGRLLRYVYVGDLMVNAEMVAKGYANVVTYPPDVKYSEHFVALEAQARNNSLGLWATPSPQPTTITQPAPSGGDITVYITRTGEKYHRDGCRYLRQSKIPISLADAKAQGYGP